MKKYLPWIFIGFLQTIVSPPGQAAVDGPVPSVEQSLPKSPAQGLNEQSLIDHGQALYDQGQFSEAAGVLNQALVIATQQGDRYSQVLVFRNLALVDLQQGHLDQAEEFIQKSFALVPTLSKQEQSTLQPSLLEVEGGLQVQQGKANQAYTTWEKASGLYEQLGKQDQVNRIRINQAYALQQMGFYPRAIALLTPIADQLNRQPDSISKATTFRSLGEALYSTGDLTQAEPRLVASLEIAQRLRLGNAVSQAQISLANLKRAQGKDNEALVLYRQAAAGTTSPLLKVQSEVNELGLLIETGEFPEAQSLWPKIQAQLDTAPTSRDLISARINLATRLMSAGAQVGAQPQTIYEFLAVAIKQSQAIKDSRIESFALGTLGKLYEQQSQFADAVRLTERALQIAQNSNSLDILYRWQWQLGRIYKAQSELASNDQNLQRSIDAYSGAVKTLRSLRTDLVSANPTAQVSFQDSAEPIHRELVSLLLDARRGEVSQQDLDQARNVIESLQLAELDNFFREACLQAAQVNIDNLDTQAAVVYPILLKDRLEVIVSFPKQKLRHYSVPVTSQELEPVANRLRQNLVIRVGNSYLADSQQLYDWIIRPAEKDLEASKVKTLVFVLDGALRNLPMASLNDGKQFLVEKYSLALTPGLQLVNPRPLQEKKLSVLGAALSESRQGFSSLPNITAEVKDIQDTLPVNLLLNQQFTESGFKDQLTSRSSPIVHLATHGKFSSKLDDTFVLTWDGRLDISSLTNLLKTQELRQNGNIELLVLSACETATGDKLAALGMAGLAVRAGARSTVASLWQINDEATATLMNHFYQELVSQKVTKAEALRSAQLEVLKDPRFRGHPYFWAPYILVGNWL